MNSLLIVLLSGRRWLALAICLGCGGSGWLCQLSFGQQQNQLLVVAAREVPPFAMKTPDDSWHGLSIDLWAHVASELGLKYEIREMPLADMLRQLETGEVDVAVGALTVTARREAKMDFSHSFLNEGLGIAVRKRLAVRETKTLLSNILWPLVTMIGGLALLALLAGIVIWLVERRKNPEQFGPRTVEGVGNGIWWAVVTMTTVGYGDKSPRTALGRLIAIIWIFAGIVLISLFTAAVTTRLTLSSLEQEVREVRDLKNFRVGCVSETTGSEFLTRNAISRQDFPDVELLLQALAAGEIDAGIYDLPVLRYLITRNYQRELRVSQHQIEPAQYAFAFPADSNLREPVNRVLLARIRTPLWTSSLKQYLGD